MAGNPPWDTEKLCSHAPRVGAGELAQRQQVAMLKGRQPRPRLTEMDRIFWVLLRLWVSWRHSLRPETVVGWHRQGFRRYWAWKSRRRRGRPGIRTELRDLIRRMSGANPLGVHQESTASC
jgi:putative transposase